MGLFRYLFSKLFGETPYNAPTEEVINERRDNPGNQPISFTISTSVTSVVKDKMLDEYFYPPDISHLVRYCVCKVKGKNPATNRQKTCNVVVKENATDAEICLASGLLEPHTITRFEPDEPSQAQVNYAKSLNIVPPMQCTKEDMSCLISKALGEDSNDLRSNELSSYAAKNGLYLSPYCGKVGSINCTYHHLQTREKIAFFIYLIYAATLGLEIEDPSESQHKDVFYNFADDHINDSTMTEVMNSFYHDHFEFLITKNRIDGRSKSKKQLCDTILDYLTDKIPSFKKP